MKPVVAVLVLLFFLLVTAQGIRLQQSSISAISQKIHEKKEKEPKEENVDEDKGVVLHCGVECSGRSRKLLTKTRPASQNLKTNMVEVEARLLRRSLSKAVIERNDENSVRPPIAEFEYPDIVDIAGMDYSPARRKSPIHN